MNQAAANALFEECAFLIIAGVPPGTEFGIDLKLYQVGEEFRGIKLIPPGVHYIHTAAQDLHGNSAPRTGFMHFFNKQEIVIREWDIETEELKIRTKGDPAIEEQRIKENIRNLDRFLGPYDFENLPRWRLLSQYITAEEIKKRMPECGVIRTSVELLSCPDAERPRGAITRTPKQCHLTDEEELLPNLKPVPGTCLHLTELPERYSKTAEAQEISLAYMDSIRAVEELLENYDEWQKLLAECQFAFVAFAAGGSFDALSHWRKMLALLANSESAVDKYERFYCKYLPVLADQLVELPEEMLMIEINKHRRNPNTVYNDVANLLKNCNPIRKPGMSVDVDRFMGALDLSINWTFDNIFEEDGDDLPVVVET